MKIYHTIRKHYEMLGIAPSQQSTQGHAFNTKILCGFLLFGCSMASRFIYIFYVASGFMEYVQCICVTSASIITFTCFSATVFKMTDIFEKLDDIEQLIETSKFLNNKIYNFVDEKKCEN